MIVYNMNFLIAALVILVIVLWQIFNQRRMEDANNRVFRLIVFLGFGDIITEIISSILIMHGTSTYGGAAFATTIFYLFQAALPLSLVYYVRTLKENKAISVGACLLMGIPTMILLFCILTNPFTGLLFYFNQAGYEAGPCYMAMYYSALAHITAALAMVIAWRKRLGRSNVIALMEVFLVTIAGILIQTINNSILMTGFGLSLAILAMFLTINNPYANTDSLTGLYDKQYLLQKMNELIAGKHSFHIVTVYAYQLEHVNKVAGVHSGDQLLQTVAERLQQLCGTKAFRITGKRFLLLAESLEEYETILQALRELFNLDADFRQKEFAIPLPVILSGILNAQKLNDGGMVLDYAEYLESLSSQCGGTEIIQDDPKTLDSFHYNKKVEQFLHKAIEEDLFEVYYQPVYSIQERRFITLEALSRLHHPELGWIAPDVFIQVAEKNHLIDQITELQLRRICRFMKENEIALAGIENVKVNLSPLDLMRHDCGEHLIHILDEYGLPYSRFQFEITETVATEYTSSLSRLVEIFQKAGIGLCLDDFGSGYANLNTVMQLPFSAIKLDRSLLFHICTDEKSALFYQSIVYAFRKMGYKVISEGVETEAEKKLLQSWNVDMIQGYYFSKPLPPKMLLGLLS